jgi:hypothetical protein
MAVFWSFIDPTDGIRAIGVSDIVHLVSPRRPGLPVAGALFKPYVRMHRAAVKKPPKASQGFWLARSGIGHAVLGRIGWSVFQKSARRGECQGATVRRGDPECWPGWFRSKPQMFASRVAILRKCSHRWLQKLEGLTFPAVRFGELAPGKVANWNERL